MRKWSTLAMFVVLLVGTSGLAYGVGLASGRLSGQPRSLAVAPRTALPSPTPTATRRPSTPRPSPTPTPPTAPAMPSVSATPSPSSSTKSKRHATPRMRPGPRLLGPGDDGRQVRELQARLRQIAWFSGDVTDHYGTVTETAVRGFQAKRGIPVTGYVDRRTMDRLLGMTHEPSADELANRSSSATTAALDPRCTTGRTMCIDKTSRTLRWVVDGKVLKTLDVRFGASYSPTREGLFHVEWMDADHVSHLYGSAMPYSMFFSRGQAVHYSSDFAARGYYGASHGCVNVRDYDGVRWLFGQVHVGDKVVVYWS